MKHLAFLLLLVLSSIAVGYVYGESLRQLWQASTLQATADRPHTLTIADDTGHLDWRVGLATTGDAVHKDIVLPSGFDLDAYRSASLNILMAGSALSDLGTPHTYNLVVQVDGVEVKRYAGGPPEDADWRAIPLDKSLLRGKDRIMVTARVTGRPDADWNYANIYGSSGPGSGRSRLNNSPDDLSTDDGIQTGEYMIRLQLDPKPLGKAADLFPIIPAYLLFTVVLYNLLRFLLRPAAAAAAGFLGLLLALAVSPVLHPLFLATSLLLVAVWCIAALRHAGEAMRTRVIVATFLVVLWFGLQSRWNELLNVVGTPLSPQAASYSALAESGYGHLGFQTGPLFVWIVKAASSVLGPSELALRYSSLVLSLLLIVIAFALAAKMLNAYFGLLLALALALNGALVASSVQGTERELEAALGLAFLLLFFAGWRVVRLGPIQARPLYARISWQAFALGAAILLAGLVSPLALLVLLPLGVYRLEREKPAFSLSAVGLAWLSLTVFVTAYPYWQVLPAQIHSIASNFSALAAAGTLWTFGGAEGVLAPALVDAALSFASIGLLVGACRAFRSNAQGWLAGSILLGSLYFIRQGAAQYGDVALSFFILATIVLSALAEYRQERNYDIVAGLCAGLAAGTKNEGLLFLVCFLFSWYLTPLLLHAEKRTRREVMALLAGLLPILVPVLYLKLYLAPGNVLAIQPVPTMASQLLDPARYAQIAQAFADAGLALAAGPGVLLALYLALTGATVGSKLKPVLVSSLVTLGLVLAGYWVIYLIGSNDLQGPLQTSPRLLVPLLPAGLFAFFLAAATPEELWQRWRGSPVQAPEEHAAAAGSQLALPRTNPRTMKIAVPLLAVYVLGYVALGIATLPEYGLTWDEGLGNMFFGERYLHYMASFDPAYLAMSWPDLAIHNRPLNLFLSPYYDRPQEFPPLVDTLSALSMEVLSYRFGWLDPVDAFHLVKVLLAGVLLAAMFIFAAPRLGVLAASLAVLITSMYPRFWGDMHFNPKDIPEAVFFALTLMGFLAWYERPSHWRALGVGLLLGAALSTKANALFIAPVIIVGVWPWEISKRPWGQVEAHLARYWDHYAIIIGAAIAFHIEAWPYVYSDPARLLGYYDYIFSQGGRAGAAAWNWDPLIQFVTTMPEIDLLLLLIGISLVIWRRKTAPPVLRLLLVWLLVSLVRSSIPGAVNFDGIRHFEEVVPAAGLLAGWGGAELVQALGRLRQWARPAMHLAAAGLVLVVVGSVGGVLVRYHPFEHTYYNSFVGGLSGAQSIYRFPEATDYWAGSYRQGMQWLNANAPPRSLVYVPVADWIAWLTAPLWLRGDMSIIHQSDLKAVAAGRAVYVMFVTRSDWYTPLARYSVERLQPAFQIVVDRAPVLVIYRLDSVEGLPL